MRTSYASAPADVAEEGGSAYRAAGAREKLAQGQPAVRAQLDSIDRLGRGLEAIAADTRDTPGAR
jgi:hypothetical protein